MVTILRQMFFLLSPKERGQAYRCFAAMLMMALVEVVGVASIMPFIAVLSDPESITHHAKLALLYNKLHFTDPHQFLIFLGLLVLGILVVGNGISMFTTWSIFKFTYAREYSLSTRIFKHYLAQPYLFFLNRNTSELSKNVLSEVITIINRAFIPAMQLIAKSIIAGLILLLLLIIDPVLAFVLGGILGGAYIGIYVKVRRKLAAISKRCLSDNQKKYKIVTEALQGIKDIKLLGREQYFLDQFDIYAKQHADDGAVSNIIAHIPRYALETIAFGGVLILILYLLMSHQNMADAMPLLAVYAFASLRLMPALQQIFTSIAFMKVSKDALNILTMDLKDEQNTQQLLRLNAVPIQPLSFNQGIAVHQLNFSYPNTTKPVIQDLTMEIKAYSTVGFVGMTGAGKTTLVDILLGLLRATSGQILIDGQPLTVVNLSSWQHKIGYVPQAIFLADETITQNIAFGVAPSEIDHAAILRAAKMANIHQFITQELPQGYQTIVGDRGIRLSGGQRQRIGIARALYHDPQILVMDEATNALDNMTESIIMDAMTTLAQTKTMIIVAHKLSTLKECDQIYVFANGTLQTKGKYEELIAQDETFRLLAGKELQGNSNENTRYYTSSG